MTAATQLIRTRARRAITELDRARTAVERCDLIAEETR